MSSDLPPLREATRARRILLCVGSGGVGKTTTAAALALSGALAGRKTVVCTIDPARRLANALGLTSLGNAEQQISDGTGAPLFAMMLDMKRTWDGFLEHCLSTKQREAIFQNRFYQSLSTKLAGSQEYIAMQKLWELRQERDYQLVVLDTPPTAPALNFLDAPRRVLDFFDNEAARWLLTPALMAGKASLQLFRLTSSFATRALSKLTGMETLQELAGLLLATEGIHETVRQRAQDIEQMLRSPETAFVLVTDLTRTRLEETIDFYDLLQSRGMSVAAIVVNRFHPAIESIQHELVGLAPALNEKLEKSWLEHQAQADQDILGAERLRERCHPTPLVRVPQLEGEVYDLAALQRVAGHLMVL